MTKITKYFKVYASVYQVEVSSAGSKEYFHIIANDIEEAAKQGAYKAKLGFEVTSITEVLEKRNLYYVQETQGGQG